MSMATHLDVYINNPFLIFFRNIPQEVSAAASRMNGTGEDIMESFTSSDATESDAFSITLDTNSLNATELSFNKTTDEFLLNNGSWKQLGLDNFRTTYFFIFGTLTLTANLLTLVAIKRYKSLKSTVSVYITSLCLADFIGFPTLLLGQFLHYIKDDYVFKLLFAITQCFHSMSLGLSLLTHFITACDRYSAVIHPLRYRSLEVSSRKFRAVTRVIGIWIYTSLIIIPPLSYFITKAESSFLRHRPRLVLILPPWVRIIIFDAHVITFLSITLFLYSRVIYQLRRKNIIHDSLSPTITQKTRATTKMMAVVLATMVTCWLPWNIWSTLSNKDNLMESLNARLTHEFTLLLLYANSFVNPLIYWKMSADFRRAYKKLLRCNLNSSGNTSQVTPVNNNAQNGVQQVFHVSR